MAFRIAKLYNVRETIGIPHPGSKSLTDSNLGSFTPAEIDKLVESYRECGYRARRTHSEDGRVTWIFNIGSKVKIVLECIPYSENYGG